MRKQGGKTGGLKPGTQLMKNLLNSMRKQGEKPIICYFAGDENPPKSSEENKKKN